MTDDQRIVILEELVMQQEEYIDFLTEEEKTPITLAYMHGWVVSKEVADKGKSFRERIQELKSKVFKS